MLSSEKIDITQLLNSEHKKQLKNPFWEEIFNAWRELQLKLQIDQLNINTCNIWNNENIKVGYQTVFYKDWAKRDVYMINAYLLTSGNCYGGDLPPTNSSKGEI